MKISGQMARVPVTARQKFSEAAYFYNAIVAPHKPCALSIFPKRISLCLRSVTWYLQKAVTRTVRVLYPQKQAEMEADPVLRMLNQRRVAVVHRAPFDLHFKKGFRMPDKYGEYRDQAVRVE